MTEYLEYRDLGIDELDEIARRALRIARASLGGEGDMSRQAAEFIMEPAKYDTDDGRQTNPTERSQ